MTKAPSVIASEAKHPELLRGENGLRRRSAPRNDDDHENRRAAKRREKTAAPKTKILTRDQCVSICPVLAVKIISFVSHPNQRHIQNHPALAKRGVSRSSRTLVRDAVDASLAERRTARLCGRRSRVVLTPRRWRQVGGMIRRRWWQESPIHQGEREASR